MAETQTKAKRSHKAPEFTERQIEIAREASTRREGMTNAQKGLGFTPKYR